MSSSNYRPFQLVIDGEIVRFDEPENVVTSLSRVGVARPAPDLHPPSARLRAPELRAGLCRFYDLSNVE